VHSWTLLLVAFSLTSSDPAHGWTQALEFLSSKELAGPGELFKLATFLDQKLRHCFPRTKYSFSPASLKVPSVRVMRSAIWHTGSQLLSSFTTIDPLPWISIRLSALYRRSKALRAATACIKKHLQGQSSFLVGVRQGEKNKMKTMARSWRTERLGWSRSPTANLKTTIRQRNTPDGAFPRRSSTLTRLVSDAITHLLVPRPTKAISLSAQPAVLNCDTSKPLHNAASKSNNYNSTLSNAPDKQRFKQWEPLQLNNETRDPSCAEGAVVGLAADTHIFLFYFAQMCCGTVQMCSCMNEAARDQLASE